MTYKQRLEKALVELVEKWNPKAKVYAVGGYVRDEIMGRINHDLDVVIDLDGSSNPAVEFVEYLKSNNIPGTSGYTVFPRFGTAKFDLKDPASTSFTSTEQIECVMPRVEEYNSGPRKPSEVKKTTLEVDACRRDFCCNALYKDLKTGKILDPTGKGLSDIKNKILRTPLSPEETFKDDPLRMLRAIRFASRLKFKIHPDVLRAIKPIPEYTQLSMERVRDEFEKIITSPIPSGYVRLVHETGLLRYIVPELEEAWGFNQNSKYHSLNLSDHLLLVLDKTVYELSRGTRSYSEASWAALLHDISKYKEYQTKEDGSFSFHGHEKTSAEMSKSILRRLKYSEEMVEKTAKLISDHMIIKQFYDYSKDCYTGNNKTTRKILVKYPDNYSLDCLLALIDADNNAHAPKYCMPGQVASFREAVDKILGSPFATQYKRTSPIGGKDIMSRYGLKPGKQIGEIKHMLEELYYGSSNIDKENLFRAYEGEFGGKKVWSWKTVYGWECMSIVEPHQETLHGAIGYDVDSYMDSVRLDDGETYLPDGSAIVELNAIEYPNLYMRCRIHRRSQELVDKILDIMEEFQEMPDFKEVKVGLDNSNDASGYIKWDGHRTDYIL